MELTRMPVAGVAEQMPGGDAPVADEVECALSALVVAHNEEQRLATCLERLRFADEIVVVLDKCTDASKAIASRFTRRLVEGDWEYQGDRRNRALRECHGDWILEVDADEQVSDELAAEIRRTIETSNADWHLIPFNNYVGTRLIKHGWGGSFGVGAAARLFRKGSKTYHRQRVHVRLALSGQQGPALKHCFDHFVDDDISDMIRRLDRYTTQRAKDLRESPHPESLRRNLRRILSRFFKCYVSRKGYREGAYGFLIALFAGLYPILSYLKATLEDDARGSDAG